MFGQIEQIPIIAVLAKYIVDFIQEYLFQSPLPDNPEERVKIIQERNAKTGKLYVIGLVGAVIYLGWFKK